MSEEIDPDVVERMQIEYEKDPGSKVFAPLADIYRKMGLVDEGLRIAQAGVANHPNFASGRVVLARVLCEMEEWAGALTHIEKAVELSPDNRAAHLLLGQTLVQLRRPKDALKAYKMLLFLNPNDAQATEFVRKWEFLTAEDYTDEVFNNLAERKTAPTPAKLPQGRKWEIDRAISLADALTIRNDVDAAINVLTEAKDRLGKEPELVSRLQILADRGAPSPVDNSSVSTKRERLEKILQRIINYRKVVDPSRPFPR